MTSAIEWTDRTWDPVEGCRRKSPGCDHCWAVQLIGTRFRTIPAYDGLVVDGQFTGKVTLRADRLNQPVGARTAARWFVCSRSDLFGSQVPDAYIAAIWCRAYWTSTEVRGRMSRRLKPVQTFQVLTKRERRMEQWVKGWTSRTTRKEWVRTALERGWCDHADVELAGLMPDVMPNIWLGVSVESQEYADQRVPALCRTPAAVRWVSAEPLLGPVDLSRWLTPRPAWGPEYVEPTSPAGLAVQDLVTRPGIDWVVAGGETAPRARAARPMHPDWARALRDQAQAAGVGYFFKQWGAWAPPDQFDTVGYDDVEWDQNAAITMWPDGRIVAGVRGEFRDGSEHLWPAGKRYTGHRLDDVEHLDGPRPAVRV